MKKLIFLAALVLSVLANAQDINEINMKTVGEVELVVSYKLDQLCDYPNQWRDFDWREEETIILETGEGKAHSYVVREHNKNMQWLNYFKTKNRWWTENINIRAQLGETFIGIPKSGYLTQFVNLDAAGVFQYDEPVPSLEWTITNEHKKVLDYDCTLATCSFRGREYQAWFAPEIPVSFGPWKFGGLPGLILELSDSKNEYNFVATGIERPKTPAQIQIFDEDIIRPVKREKALKMEAMLHRDHGLYAADYGIMFSMEGHEHDNHPYHPLELE